jgi:hypothetical protein
MTQATPTREDIQKVREYECRMNGHIYSHLEAMFVDGPIAVVCMNCGKKWAVKHEDDE